MERARMLKVFEDVMDTGLLLVPGKFNGKFSDPNPACVSTFEATDEEGFIRMQVVYHVDTKVVNDIIIEEKMSDEGETECVDTLL